MARPSDIYTEEELRRTDMAITNIPVTINAAGATGDFPITDWIYDGTDDIQPAWGQPITITPPQPNPTRELEAVKTLELAEEQLKKLLDETPATISIDGINDQKRISDALEEVQFAIRELLKCSG